MAAAGVVALTAACGSKFDPAEYPTPELLYEATVALYQEGKCHQAVDGFRSLTFELNSFDPRLVEVRYFLADCTLDQGERLEAARLFRRVADEYPRHPLAAAALLRAGDSYSGLWKKPTLDPTYGEAAMATYRELLARYPASDAADSAQGRIAGLNEWFAQKEYKDGEFYYRLRAFDSAIIYYKDWLRRTIVSGTTTKRWRCAGICGNTIRMPSARTACARRPSPRSRLTCAAEYSAAAAPSTPSISGT
jgi:outer membrane protein assembly factor BamD